MNKLCLRIKIALIIKIYRKAILVRLDEMNKLLELKNQTIKDLCSNS